jgi:hypothetical protein
MTDEDFEGIIEDLEVKLAKAVEGLRGCMHCHDCTCGECDHIRTTLAEIEGERG